MEMTAMHHSILEQVREKYGFISLTETVRFLIAEARKKHLDNYVELAKLRLDNKLNKNPRDRIREKIETKEIAGEIRAEKKQEKIRDLCSALGGTEYVDPVSGRSYCNYTVFEQLNRFEIVKDARSVPFEALNDSLIPNQYRTMHGTTGEEAKNIIEEQLLAEIAPSDETKTLYSNECVEDGLGSIRKVGLRQSVENQETPPKG